MENTGPMIKRVFIILEEELNTERKLYTARRLDNCELTNIYLPEWEELKGKSYQGKQVYQIKEIN